MPHNAQERYSNLVDIKLRSTLVTKDNYIFNNRYEGSPKAGKVKIPVRDTEVEVKSYSKQCIWKQSKGHLLFTFYNLKGTFLNIRYFTLCLISMGFWCSIGIKHSILKNCFFCQYFMLTRSNSNISLFSGITFNAPFLVVIIAAAAFANFRSSLRFSSIKLSKSCSRI